MSDASCSADREVTRRSGTHRERIAQSPTENRSCVCVRQQEKKGDEDQFAFRLLIDRHIDDYLTDSGAQKKRAAEECEWCHEQSVREKKKVGEKSPSPKATPPGGSDRESSRSLSDSSGRSSSCSSSADDDLGARKARSKESSSHVDITVKEICDKHKRLLERSADLLKSIESKKSCCDVCKLVGDEKGSDRDERVLYGLQIHVAADDTDRRPARQKATESRVHESGAAKEAEDAPRCRARPANPAEKPAKKSNPDRRPPAPSTTSVKRRVKARTETSADRDRDEHDSDGPVMPRDRFQDDSDDCRTSTRKTAKSGGQTDRVCTCGLAQNVSTRAEDDRVDDGPVADNDRRQNESYAVVICIKCGGEVDGVEPTGRKRDCNPAKSILAQKNDAPGKQKPSRTAGKTYNCTCSEQSEEDDRAKLTAPSAHGPGRKRPQAQLQRYECVVCGGAIADAEEASDDAEEPAPRGGRRPAKSNREEKTKSETDMNEAIMTKRQEVWGDNVPPEFIITGTVYADRHADCCVKNADSRKGMRYTCPNAPKKYASTSSASDTGDTNDDSDDSDDVSSDDDDDDDDDAQSKTELTLECVLLADKSLDTKPSGQPQERLCAGSRRADEGTATRRPPPDRSCKRAPEAQPSRTKKTECKTNEKQCPQTASSRRPADCKPPPGPRRECVDARKQEKGCLPESRSQEKDRDFCAKPAARKNAKSEAESGECRRDGRKGSDMESSSWYEMIDKQMRSYMDIDYDSNEELMVCQPLSADDEPKAQRDRWDAKRPMFACVLALPPPERLRSTKRPPTSRDRSVRGASRERVEKRSDSRPPSKDSQAPKRSDGAQCRHKQTQTSKDSLGSLASAGSRASVNRSRQDVTRAEASPRRNVKDASTQRSAEDLSEPPVVPDEIPPDPGPRADADPPDEVSDKGSRISIRIASIKRSQDDAPPMSEDDDRHKQTQTSISVRKKKQNGSSKTSFDPQSE